jgi:hypothetical protein
MHGLRVAVLFLAALPACASHLVTGNGYGFGVVDPERARLTGFYAHPYSFARPDANNPLAEGIETTNFIKSLSWSDAPNRSANADYVQNSHIIRAHCAASDGIFFMPFGLEFPALIVIGPPASNAELNTLIVEWRHPLESKTALADAIPGVQILRFQGVPESLLLVPLDAATNVPPGPEQPLANHHAWALVSLEPGIDPQSAIIALKHWRANLSPGALVHRELMQLEAWRVASPAHLSERELALWRQSEVMLRMAQSREPNRAARHGNGLIVACLPDGVYFTPWVRDMAWATVALIRMGHHTEARAALLAYFNAQPTGKMRDAVRGDYQVSVVRYFGDGAEEPFFTMEGATNIEFDDWGEVLWVLGEYQRRFHDSTLLDTPTFRGPLYQSTHDFIVQPLLRNIEPFGPGAIVAADTSIWEEHQPDQKHFAFSTAMAIVGLRNFADIAHEAGDAAAANEALRQADQLQKGFNAAFIRDGQLHGTLEPGIKNDIDGALLAIINFGVVSDPALLRSTVERMQLLKVASGGYRRVRGTYTDPAIFEYWYEQEEFVFVDFSLAEVDRRLGRDGDSADLLKRITDKSAADHNILPEMYVAVPCKLFPGAVGDPTGALPMVGYGAGEFILQMLQRSPVR